jgi:stearoyl-CoA desaturase (delta-9 desaturase)
MFRGFLGLIDETKAKNIPPRLIRDLISNPVVMFFHNWYWPTIILYVMILVICDPMLVLFCYVIPVGYTKFITGSQISLGHGAGYRNFDTADNSVNNKFINYLTLGEGLHNNHHARPGEFDFGFTGKRHEWDFCGTLVRLFFQ